MTPNEVEKLFLKLMESAVINIERLERGIDNVLNTQENLVRDFRDFQQRFEHFFCKFDDSCEMTKQNFDDVKKDLNLFTRRVDTLNREILAVKSEQISIAEGTK